MRTTVYNTAKRSVTFVLALALLAAMSVKAQELTLNTGLSGLTDNVTATEDIQNKSEVAEPTTYSNILIELKDWMRSGSYWESVSDPQPDTASGKEKLMQMISEWMKDGAYWKDNANDKTEEDYLTEPVASMEEE